jgi:transcriptional antiterminator NusG
VTNTYAINTTRGKEFQVETELHDLGLKPWVPKRLESRYVKEKREAVWYDKPYVPKLMFCVIPAIYYRDVTKLKHVIGKPYELSRLDVQGIPAHRKRLEGEAPGQGTGEKVPGIPGLLDFRKAVEAEYADAQRRKVNSEYQCQYTPGQALEILNGPFTGFRGPFQKVIKKAHNDYARLRVAVEVFGRETTVEVDPDAVRAG